MSTWRPHPHIRVVALGLHWRGGRLLAAEVRDDAARIKGVRPLGGEIEFGESWRTALVREFNEELGVGHHHHGRAAGDGEHFFARGIDRA